MTTPWIQTFSGLRFDLLDPKPSMICLEDIAHALSLICRFTGHTRRHYSVAQHSVLVAVIAHDSVCGAKTQADIFRQGLMHDAAEAYIGDISTPLKRLLPRAKEIEAGIWLAIAKRFRLPAELDPIIKAADIRALVTERRDLLGASLQPWDASIEAILPMPAEIRRWSPKESRKMFLECADEFGIR